jgi:hypothetical protein
MALTAATSLSNLPVGVKKLDLLESNHDCGLNGLSRGKHSKTEVTQRYAVHI